MNSDRVMYENKADLLPRPLQPLAPIHTYCSPEPFVPNSTTLTGQTISSMVPCLGSYEVTPPQTPNPFMLPPPPPRAKRECHVFACSPKPSTGAAAPLMRAFDSSGLPVSGCVSRCVCVCVCVLCHRRAGVVQMAGRTLRPV